jgi:hypothetical protein
MTEHGNHPNGGGFEREDVGIRPVFGFLVSLVVTGVLVYYVIWGMFHFMDAYHRKHQHAKSPMVQAEQDTRESNTEKTYEKIQQKFPEPRLEGNEVTEINDFRYQQDETLSSYGWVDQSGGVVRIPIDRAMQLIAQRGLPTIPQAGATPASAAGGVQAPAKKKTGKGKKQ